MATKIKLEGLADLDLTVIRCVCGHCGTTSLSKALIEFNFQEQRVIYVCGKCKKENSVQFGKENPPPYPRSRVGLG